MAHAITAGRCEGQNTMAASAIRGSGAPDDKECFQVCLAYGCFGFHFPGFWLPTLHLCSVGPSDAGKWNPKEP